MFSIARWCYSALLTPQQLFINVRVFSPLWCQGVCVATIGVFISLDLWRLRIGPRVYLWMSVRRQFAGEWQGYIPLSLAVFSRKDIKVLHWFLLNHLLKTTLTCKVLLLSNVAWRMFVVCLSWTERMGGWLLWYSLLFPLVHRTRRQRNVDTVISLHKENNPFQLFSLGQCSCLIGI